MDKPKSNVREEKPANNGEANKKDMARKVVRVEYDLTPSNKEPSGRAPTGRKKTK